MLTESELGYLAGIIDGEGSITLQRSLARSSSRYVYPVVTVANTDKRLIDWLIAKTGQGHWQYQTRTHLGCKSVYHWCIACNQAYDLLVMVRDYLVIKQLQADVAIALWTENQDALELAGRRRWGNHHPIPSWLQSWREASYLFMRDLNRRGPGGPKHGKEVLALAEKHCRELARWRLLPCH
jgi:hypothetical protein